MFDPSKITQAGKQIYPERFNKKKIDGFLQKER